MFCQQPAYIHTVQTLDYKPNSGQTCMHTFIPSILWTSSPTRARQIDRQTIRKHSPTEAIRKRPPGAAMARWHRDGAAMARWHRDGAAMARWQRDGAMAPRWRRDGAMASRWRRDGAMAARWRDGIAMAPRWRDGSAMARWHRHSMGVWACDALTCRAPNSQTTKPKELNNLL